jgi:hypothetical protein
MGWAKESCANWAADTSHILRFYYKNTTNTEQHISVISCALGTGNGKVHTSTGGTYSVNGSAVTAKLKLYYTDSKYGARPNGYTYNGAAAENIATATVSYSVSATGSNKDSSGYWYSDYSHSRNVNGISYTMPKNSEYNDYMKYKKSDGTWAYLLNSSGNKIRVDESGYFGAVSTNNTNFKPDSVIKVPANTTYYFAVYKSSSGGILSSRGAPAPSGTVTAKQTCTGSVSIPSTVLSGNSIKATVSGQTSNSSVSYKWYTKDNTEISGQTSSTLAANKVATGVYCKVTISKTDYYSTTATSGTVTVYTAVTSPTTLNIVGSRDDGRYTDRENYSFKWSGAKNGTNNNIQKYRYRIKNGSKYDSGEKDTTSTSVSEISASTLKLARGDTLTLYVQAIGQYSDGHGATKSTSVIIQSAAIVRIKVDSTWKDGIVYINKGTSDKPDWVEADEVKIKDGSTWKTST